MADSKRWFSPLSLLLGACLVCGPGLATEIPKPEEWSIESRREVFALDGATVVEFDQALGDFRIEGAEVDSVIVTMVIQRHRDDPRRAVVLKGDEGPALTGLALTFGFADTETPETKAEPKTWTRRRIDVGVQVPRDLNIVVRTGAGLIELEDLDSHADLSTETGEILVKGAGGLHARSFQGSIRVLVTSTQSDEPITLESVNGSVWVQLLEGASASVELETSEQITTDYSVEIHRERDSRRKVGRATVGEGRRSIRLSTVNGRARLSNVIVDEGAESSD